MFFLLEPKLYVGNTADYKPVLFSISSRKPLEPESSILIMCLIRIFMLLSEGLTLNKDFDQEKLQRQSLRPIPVNLNMLFIFLFCRNPRKSLDLKGKQMMKLQPDQLLIKSE